MGRDKKIKPVIKLALTVVISLLIGCVPSTVYTGVDYEHIATVPPNDLIGPPKLDELAPVREGSVYIDIHRAYYHEITQYSEYITRYVESLGQLYGYIGITPDETAMPGRLCILDIDLPPPVPDLPPVPTLPPMTIIHEMDGAIENYIISLGDWVRDVKALHQVHAEELEVYHRYLDNVCKGED